MAELVRWPEAAKVDRLIPKERLYAETSASTALRQRFVDEVIRVRWAYKLSEESMRLAPGEIVTEIQVFEIDLKDSNLDNSVLASIDKATPSQVIFELSRREGVGTERAMAAAYKRSGGKTKGTDYFRTDWVASDQPRILLPVALDMDRLYCQLLGHLFPYPMRAGEELSDALGRMSRIRSLGREIAALENRGRSEVQFNRKIELQHQLRVKEKELDQFTRNESSMSEDAIWRS